MASPRTLAAFNRLAGELASGEIRMSQCSFFETNLPVILDLGLGEQLLSAINAKPFLERPVDLRHQLRELLGVIAKTTSDPLRRQSQDLVDNYGREALSQIESAGKEGGSNWALMFIINGYEQFRFSENEVLDSVKHYVLAQSSRSDCWGMTTIDFLAELASKAEQESVRSDYLELAERVASFVPADSASTHTALVEFKEECA